MSSMLCGGCENAMIRTPTKKGDLGKIQYGDMGNMGHNFYDTYCDTSIPYYRFLLQITDFFVSVIGIKLISLQNSIINDIFFYYTTLLYFAKNNCIWTTTFIAEVIYPIT